MVEKELFNNPEAVFNQQGLTSGRKSVIKNNSIRVGGKKRIDHKEHSSDVGDPQVQSIVEDDQVVGIIYKCTCGKISEIRFDFDK